MNWQPDLLTDLVAMQRRQQFRMRRLQLFNWGTFSDRHDIVIAEEGFLFVGRSGSGKSTLLDALAALLVPPQWLVFNAAARDWERNRRDRNLASYVRGAWGDQKDADSGEIATRYLRTGTTWSALALTLANGEGRNVSLVQLYWLRGSACANTDVRRHYLIAERPFDIARELDGFDLDVRGLKHRLTDVDHFGDTFRSYGERFRHLLGIDSEMALKLLHKTQSAKNLGDLNAFLRAFMLDEPETFAAADRLVTEFAELDAAHQEVVTARRQVPVLLRMRLLNPALRDCLGGLGDIQAPVAEIAALRLPVARTLIVENLQTGLALEEMTGAVAFMGQGYAVELFGEIPWLQDIPCIYWGDLDSHGLATLDRLRCYLPHVHSLLMDEETLLAHRDLWVHEPSPALHPEMPRLNDSEMAVVQALRECRWGSGVRPEQERIPWPYVEQKLGEMRAAVELKQSTGDG